MSQTVASGVTLSLGLLTAQVSMTSALEAKVSNTNVCTGPDGGAEHEITKVQSKTFCPTCDDTVAYTDIKKARAVGKGFVLLTAEDLAEVSEDAEPFKKVAALTAHPTEDVDLHTTTGDTLYYLEPSAGSEPVYAVLLELVTAHPELTFTCRWSPRSRISTYALKAFNGVLCLQKRAQAESIRLAPQVKGEANAAMVGMAEQLLALPGLVVPFDPSTYADVYEARVAALVAERTPVTAASPDAPVAAVAGDPMAALQAMLDAATKTA